MATVIQIKRSTSGLAPNTSVLAEAELAYSQDKSNDGANAILYIESVDNADNPVIQKVGGKYYTDIVDAATDSDSASTLVKRDADGSFTANIITANEFVGNLTGTIDGTANAATQLETPRTITLDGDLEGSVLFDGSSDVTIYANVLANGIALGTDTVGDYVANITPGTGIDVTGYAGETANLTVTLADTSVVAGTYGGSTDVPSITIDAQGRITSAANSAISTTLNFSGDSGSNTLSLINDTLVIHGNDGGIFTQVTDNELLITNTGVVNVYTDSNLTADADSGNVLLGLADTTVSPDTYGGVGQIPVFTVDAKGRLTSAANSAISTSFTIRGDTGTDTFNTSDVFDILGVAPGISTAATDNTISITNTGVTEVTSAGHGIVASASTGNVQLTFTGVGSVSGTSGEIVVDAATGNVTIGLPSNVTIQNDLTVTGNLNVLGTAVTIGVANFVVDDPLIHLANTNTSSDVVDIGFEGHYFDAVFGNRHAGLFRDASDSGIFKLFANVSAELENATTVDTNDPGFTIATLVANLTGANVSNLLNPIAVADGGTGRITLTANAVLYGDGTNAVALATGSSGEVLQIGTDGAVTFAGIDGGTY